MHSQERTIINRALDFADTRVNEIMIPIQHAFLLPAHKTVQGVVSEVIDNGFSRIPVYEKNKNTIIGIVLVKDILAEINKDHGRKTLKHLLLSPFFVSDMLEIHILLREFKKRSFHLAVVKNAKNKVVGIVTLEDLLEELVGEIEDESDVRL